MRTIPMPYRRTPEVAAYEEAMHQGLQTVCVTPRPQGWLVKRPKDKSGKLFVSKQKAIQHAQQQAKLTNARVFVYRTVAQVERGDAVGEFLN